MVQESEVVTLSHLVCLQVNLDSIEDLDVGVAVADGSTVVGGDVRDATGTDTDTTDL